MRTARNGIAPNKKIVKMSHIVAVLLMLALVGCNVRRNLPAVTYSFYIPNVTITRHETLHGVEIGGYTPNLPIDLEYIHSRIVRTWLYYGREPDSFTDSMDYLSSLGQVILVTVKGDKCYLTPDEQPAFFEWLSLTVADHPEVDIWEAWNEPDTPFNLCAAPFYGGWNVTPGAAAYAEFVSRFYDTVKSVNPSARVMVGSFMLDNLTDPVITGFIADTLKQARYDIIGMHKYSWYGVSHPESIANLSAKVDWLRTLTPAPIYITETSMLYDGNCLDKEFQASQADWLTEINRYADDSGIAAVVWYGLYIDWRCSAMDHREVYHRAHEVNR